jgi:hypothetical protein
MLAGTEYMLKIRQKASVTVATAFEDSAQGALDTRK